MVDDLKMDTTQCEKLIDMISNIEASLKPMTKMYTRVIELLVKSQRKYPHNQETAVLSCSI
jgi:hypothetical protein